MLKQFLKSLLLVAGMAIVAAPAYADPAEFIGSKDPQTIEKISGNIVTFRNKQGQRNDYYVPSWMIEKYSLKEGTASTLYNKNIIQGFLQPGYYDVADDSILPDGKAYSYHRTRVGCPTWVSPASDGLEYSSRVWYKEQCCFSTIPVVGAMSFYVKKDIVVPASSVMTVPPAAPAQPPVYQEPPVRGRG